ncbi:unnamed protein product, partial [marine sediment metagenome]
SDRGRINRKIGNRWFTIKNSKDIKKILRIKDKLNKVKK